MRAVCPHCFHITEIPIEYIEQDISCPTCKKNYKAEKVFDEKNRPVRMLHCRKCDKLTQHYSLTIQVPYSKILAFVIASIIWMLMISYKAEKGGLTLFLTTAICGGIYGLLYYLIGIFFPMKPSFSEQKGKWRCHSCSCLFSPPKTENQTETENKRIKRMSQNSLYGAIISILIFPFSGIPAGIYSVAYGHLSLRVIKKTSFSSKWPKWFSIIGLLMGYLGLILGISFWVGMIANRFWRM
ncbi:MAG: hypothetical protein ACYC54_05875 [Sedimentisphaerales bacterium]